MNDDTKAIVRQVLSEAADSPHFFDLSDAQRLNKMIALAYTLGTQASKPERPASKRTRKSVPNRPRGASVQLTIQLRPQTRAVYSGRRK